jgi:GTP-binding protein
VRDAASGILLKDLTQHGASVVLVRGGRGGRGNARFARSTRQTPRTAESGADGETREVVLTLKLIADAGLVGLPNAGKSTLLRALSRSRSRTGAWKFTTLEPHLGVVELDSAHRIVIADLPGLVEGAHSGRGLGLAFLRHVERTRILVHVVAHDPTRGSPPAAEAWRTVRREIALHSPELASRKEVVVLAKCDLPGWAESLNSLRREAEGEVVPVSAVTGAGLPELLRRVADAVEAVERPRPID